MWECKHLLFCQAKLCFCYEGMLARARDTPSYLLLKPSLLTVTLVHALKD